MGLWDTTNLLKNAYISDDTTITGDCSLRNLGKSILIGGLDASGTIIFNTPPTMSGANIEYASIPISSVNGGGHSGLYVDLISNQDVGGVKNFTNNLRAHATSGDVFQAFKNTTGNAGHVLINGAGELLYYDSSAALMKWKLDPAGKLTSYGGIDISNNYMSVYPNSAVGQDGFRIYQTNPSLTGKYIFCSNEGTMGFGAGGVESWKFTNTGVGKCYSLLATNGIITLNDTNHYATKYTTVGGTGSRTRINGWDGVALSYNNGGTLFDVITAASNGVTIIKGLNASGSQTITFGSNAPTMSGTNIAIASIPASSVIGGGHSGLYVDLISNQNVGGIKNFTDGITLSNTVTNSLIAYDYLDSNNIFAIKRNGTIGGYDLYYSLTNWEITQLGDAILNTITCVDGMTATANQVMNFGTNAPICKGTNITSIPGASIIGGACDLSNNQDVGGVKNFTSALQAHATSGNVFRAFKNTLVGNAGYVLINADGGISFFDSTVSANKWVIDSAGKLTIANIITSATSGNVFQTNSGTSPYTFIGADGSIGRTDTAAGTGFFWKMSPAGLFQIKGSLGSKYWQFNGATFNYYNLSGNPQIIMNGDNGTVEIPTSLKVGNGLYSPNNGFFSVCLGQNTPLSNCSYAVVIGYGAGQILGASSGGNVVIGSLALPVNTNTGQTTAIGHMALNKHTGTGGNSAVGCFSGLELVSGTGNCFYGSASGGALRLNCNYNFSMGSDTMGTCSGVLGAFQHYMNDEVFGDTFIFFLTTNANVDAFQMMSCRGSSGVFFVRVIEADPNNGEIIVSSPVDIFTDSYLYFYNGGTLVVSLIYTGATTTGTTFTITTGLTGITNQLALVYSYTATPDNRFVGVVSYNSTTGVLVVSSSITVWTGTVMKFWTQDFDATKGQNITDCVALGKASLQNMGCNSIQNTAFGSNALNGCGAGFNNIEYLLGSYNCGFGAFAGASLSGLSSRCVFIGANSDFLGGLSKVCNEGTAIGSQAYVGADYTCAISSNAQAYSIKSTSIGAYSRANNIFGSFATTIGAYAVANGDYSCSIGTNSSTTFASSTACGGTSVAAGENTSSFGFYSRALSNYATSIGSNSTASNLYTTVCGYNSSVSGQTSTACGSNINCTGQLAVAIGSNIVLSGNFGIAIGAGITVSSQNGIAIGYLSSATHESSVALGNNVTTSVINQIVIGKSTHQVDVAGQLRIGDAGSVVMAAGSTFTTKDKYLPFEVYSTLITAATTLPTTNIYGTYLVKSPSTTALVLTLPVAAVAYNGMTIVIRRVAGSAAGAWNSATATIVNFIVGSVLQVGLLTATQSALTLQCLYSGSAYNWNMINLH